MAYERYIHVKTQRLFIVLAKRAQVVKIGTKLFDYPTTVELLNVVEEKKDEVEAKTFEAWISKGHLKRVQ